MSVNETHEMRVKRLLASIGQRLDIEVPPFGGEPERPPGDYCYCNHKVYVEEAQSKKLTDYELSLLLAHEVGHSTRRKQLIQLKLLVCLPWFLLLALMKLVPSHHPMVFMTLVIGCLGYSILFWKIQSVREECIADSYALKFSSDKKAYKQLLLKLLQERGIVPKRAMKKRLSLLE